MLKFFRHIRKKLIEEDNVQKYLLYAVGEILLVVIGILIALQVNELNESWKRVNQENYLIFELRKELQDNLVLINEDIEKNKTGLNGTLEFLQLLQERGLEEHKSKADSLIVYLYYINTIDPVSGVIDDMINTGKLDLISEDSLRKDLSNWGGEIVDLYDDVAIRNNYLFDSIVPFVSKHYPLIDTRNLYLDVTLRSPFWKVLNNSENRINLDGMYSKEMEGHLYNHALNQEYVIQGAYGYKNYIETLLAKIEPQLETQK